MPNIKQPLIHFHLFLARHSPQSAAGAADTVPALSQQCPSPGSPHHRTALEPQHSLRRGLAGHSQAWNAKWTKIRAPGCVKNAFKMKKGNGCLLWGLASLLGCSIISSAVIRRGGHTSRASIPRDVGPWNTQAAVPAPVPW